MPFTPINVVNGTTPVNATWGNNAQIQYTEAVNTLHHELFQSFVESGLVCTKDGTTANQLDVTAGIGWLTNTGDAHRRQRITVASTPGQFLTSTPSSTYYLFLNNDGTFTFSTTSTPPANSLAICQATTDGSGNILVVTDVRVLVTTLFQNMLGNIGISNGLLFGTAVSGSQGLLTYDSVNHTGVMWTPQAGATALGFAFKSWTGSTTGSPFSVGGQFGGAASYVDNAGAIHLGGAVGHVAGVATAGNFGVGAIVAQAINVAVTVTTQQTILSYTPAATGLYRVSAQFTPNNGGTNKAAISVAYTGGDSGTVYPAPGLFFGTAGGSVQDGTATQSANTESVLTPLVIYASSSGAITGQYRNNSGTPNDHVTFVIERLA